MKIDWNSFDRGVFLVNVLGIVSKEGKVLIGRRDEDLYVKDLIWSFPGGRPHYGKTLEDSLKDEIRKKTNLEVEAKKIIFARIPEENREFLLLYYLCKTVGGKEKAGEKFKEIKWIRPEELKKYFTTSLHPELMDFLKQLGDKK
jgi:ADP-ribose pyrophosphatase YjhB (NUDIX family)